jgi:hypothetical protein
MPDVSVIEVDDPEWDRQVEGIVLDPYCDRALLRAEARARGNRPVLLVTEGPQWSARVPYVLWGSGPGATLARTPDYGGPWIRGTVDDAGLAALREALDRTLIALGAVSEVALLSVWLPHRDRIAAAWSVVPTREVRVLPLEPMTDPKALAKGRRSDLSRAQRDLVAAWRPFDPSDAEEFADHHAAHMARVGAGTRWDLGSPYFRALAESPLVDAVIARADGPSGGAACVIFRSGPRAAYAFAERWGDAPGATTLALWTACVELRAGGVDELLLGGGTTDDPDDPLLAFKRSWGGSAVPMLVGARAFDRAAHDRLVAAGVARPLPEPAVLV